MKSIVIAPHPDDEVLGVGGTILRRIDEGHKVALIIVTSASDLLNWTKSQVEVRSLEIIKIKNFFGFDEVYQLNFPAACLDKVGEGNIVQKISEVFKIFEPNEVFIPHPSDVHGDHKIVGNASISASKWFRHPCISKIIAYETLSETEFNISAINAFKPNYFINIENYLENKINAMKIYKGEFYNFPFPRSDVAIRSLAQYRGSMSGFMAAEAFQILKERH